MAKLGIIFPTVAAIFIFIWPQSLLAHYSPESRKLQNIRKAEPETTQTKGEVWPKPQFTQNQGQAFMVLRPTLFKFQALNYTCDILEEGLKRYYSIILRSSGLVSSKKLRSFNWKADKDFVGYLDVLYIDLRKPCEDWPSDTMDESYEIAINNGETPGKGFLAGFSIWGILRGLETFSQLLSPTDELIALKIRATNIVDYPRFTYRSVLLDTSRHFIPKRILYDNLDLMAMNKFNVFHWHIVDSQSFPFQSKTFPELSDKGAYHPYTHVYTSQDVKEVIEYARLRGIRVIPEFDTPGHTQSWGLSTPELLTTCYNETTREPDGTYGPIDPTNPVNFIFIQKLFQEVAETFPDKYLHLGGDEVEDACWKSNPKVQEFMKMMNFSSDFTRLEDFYIQKLINIVRSLPQAKSYLVWQEVFDNKVNLDPSTIVHVWKGENMKEELFNVTAAGYRTLLSSCWYLDYISYGIDWYEYYTCDPQHFNGTLAQKKLVIGGGPAMWTEYADVTNVIPRLWPRAAVAGERLWSDSSVNCTKAATPRLEEHRCRLLRRGYPVEPMNGPGFCNVNWN